MKLFSLLPKRLVHFACNSPDGIPLPLAKESPPSPGGKALPAGTPAPSGPPAPQTA